jgi:hypothetical protein
MGAYEYAPEELKVRDQWVVWQYEHRKGGPTKVPYVPGTNRRASHSDPKTWRPFHQAVQALKTGKELAGIGYVFAENDPFAGVDIDGVRDPKTGIIEPTALEILRRLDSYGEISPSLLGAKVWVRAELPGGRARRKPGMEIYDRRRFFALTGAFLPFVSLGIEDRQAELDSLLRKAFPEPEQKPRRPYTGQFGEGIVLMAFLEVAGVVILGEVADGTAERVYRVVCPWWREHTGGDKSGTRVGQYADGALWFRCEHAHCSHRRWADLRAIVGPSQTLKRRGTTSVGPPRAGVGVAGSAVVGLG